jgi:formylglycine-generating enzyme required for sulfatase activity
MTRIFLCYASEDQAQVEAVYSRLRALDFRPWMDKIDLLPGQQWQQEIPRALRASDFIMIFFSQHSVSKRGYVQREFKLALDALQEMPEGMIHAIPVRLDDCVIPEQFDFLHWCNLYEEDGFERLVNAIRTGLAQRQQSTPKVSSKKPANQRETKGPSEVEEVRPFRRRRRILLASSVVSLLLLSAIVYWSPVRYIFLRRPTTLTNSTGMEFVLIPAGEFLMGISPEEIDSLVSSGDDTRQELKIEMPRHLVRISQAFYLGKHEVTQRQWQAVMGENPSGFKYRDWGDLNLPVEMVSWEDVQAFIDKLNKKEGAGKYRLPTEAEWEYAARAGSTTRYWWGDEVGRNRANCASCGSRWDDKQPAPVGSFPPNAFGLHDMAGNVEEWVQDCYHPNYEGAPADGGTWGGDCSLRMKRGGAWRFRPSDARLANRTMISPRSRYDTLGFRLLRAAP